jgi:hypothetical protein
MNGDGRDEKEDGKGIIGKFLPAGSNFELGIMNALTNFIHGPNLAVPAQNQRAAWQSRMAWMASPQQKRMYPLCSPLEAWKVTRSNGVSTASTPRITQERTCKKSSETPKPRIL